MAGGIASTLLCAAAPRGRDRGRAGPVRGGRAVAGAGRRRAARSARGACWRTCSATSSTATASSRRSPTAGSRRYAGDRRRAGDSLVLNADDPLVADLGRDEPACGRRATTGDRSGRVLRRRGRLARAGRAWRTPPTPSTAVAAARRTCSRPCTSAISATTTVPPADGGDPPPPCGHASVRLEGVRSARFRLSVPDGRGRGEACAARALQRLQRARGGRARRRAGDPAGGHRRGAAEHHGRVRTGGDRDGRRARDAGSCSSRTPRARTRCCARSRWSPAGTTCWECSTTTRRRPRRVLDLGRRLRAARGARAQRHVLRYAGGRAGAAPEVRGGRARAHHGDRRSPPALLADAAATRPDADGDTPLYALPDLHGDARAARAAGGDAGRRAAHGDERRRRGARCAYARCIRT